MTFLERLFLSDADQKDVSVMIPSSWAGLIAPLIAERNDMSCDQYDDLHVIRQFARLQLSSTQDLKAEYKKRLKKKCPLGIEREYKGETHVVRRVDGKYEYKQNRYNSFTEIA